MKQTSKKTRKVPRGAAAGKKKRVPVRKGADGRLHLVLHRDPVGGRGKVVLQRPVFQEAWQNEVTRATANTAYAMLREAPSVEGAVELARKTMAATSRLAEGLLARAPAGSVACRAGCDHCCHQSVGVTPPEALAIFDHLQRRLSKAELSSIAVHISDLHARNQGLSSSDRFSPEHPCAFLDAGRCSIYEVRPLSCRGMNSLDAGECATRLRDPDARVAFLANGFGGRSFMEPIRGFHAVSAGLQLGLSELYHLDMRPLDPTAVMQLLFSASGPHFCSHGSRESPPSRPRVAETASQDLTMLPLSGTVAAAPGR